MRFKVLSLLILGAILCCLPCGAIFAQKTGDNDLADLADELRAASDQDADTTQSGTAAEMTESSESRAILQAKEHRARLMTDPAWRPTHKQVDRFEISASLNNICLDSRGRILACCGDKKIRVFSANGQLLETRSLAFVPEAISVRAADGAIFVGGQGNLVRMSAEGELQEKTRFPPAPTQADSA